MLTALFPDLSLIKGSPLRLIRPGLTLLAAALTLLAHAVAQNPASATEAIRPALTQTSETLAGLTVSRWKAPGDVRSATQRDIDSIQRDLSSTLPPLMDQAGAAPGSVAAAFAVYRNIDALYDVLLRVAETATLAGSQADAANLENALSSLESARRDLGNSILQSATTHDQELTQARAELAQAKAAAATAAAAPPKKTVVDDGPEPSAKPSAKPKKKKTAPAAPPSGTNSGNPPASSPPSNPQQ